MIIIFRKKMHHYPAGEEHFEAFKTTL